MKRILFILLVLVIFVQVRVKIQFKKNVELRDALTVVNSYFIANNSLYFSSYYPEIYAAVPIVQAIVVIPLIRQNPLIKIVDTSFISVPIRYLSFEIGNQFCDFQYSSAGLMPKPCDHRVFINPQEFAR